ncbi:MAG: insulinase family protein [bacterium]|nr:insulinase family protein [bacterium]
MVRLKFILIALCASFPLQAQVNSIDSLLMNFEHYSLDNGLQIVLQQDTSVKDISVEFWVRGGVRYENKDQHGLAHFFEHVTPGTPMGKEKYDLFFSYMTNSNAQVRKDFIRYFVQVEPEGFELALQYSAGRFSAGPDRISEKNVEYERKRVLAEIERNSSNLFWSAIGSSAIDGGTYGVDHPYGHGGYGTRQNNREFIISDFKNWYDKYFKVSNSYLFIVGNFDSLLAKQLVLQYFGQFPGENFSKQPLKPGKHQNSRLTLPSPVPDSANHVMIFSWAAPEFGSKDASTLNLLSHILDKRLSKLKSLTEDVIEANSRDLVDFYEYGGQFGMYVSFSSLKDSTIAEILLKDQIESLLNYGVSNKELELGKQKVIDRMVRMQNNLGFQFSRTELLGEGLLYEDDPAYYFDQLRIQLQTTKKDIQLAAKKWLNSEPFRILFVAEDM